MWVAGLDATAVSGACCPCRVARCKGELAKCKETDAMRIDVKLREELAQQLYEESDRTGVAWVRRPESVKHAFREAAERKLRGHGEGHAGHGHAHGLGHVHNHDRPHHGVGSHRVHQAGHNKDKPVMEPCRR
jgi:hypothetical protein